MTKSHFHLFTGFGNEPILRTTQYNSLWLSQPDFVASFETSRYIYFLFRETATEAINCGKAVYSRIARVCKNDEGYDFLKVNSADIASTPLNVRALVQRLVRCNINCHMISFLCIE